MKRNCPEMYHLICIIYIYIYSLYSGFFQDILKIFKKLICPDLYINKSQYISKQGFLVTILININSSRITGAIARLS